mmetsp:Transcript_13593/g.38254  ORF Transcript_13593/g.38254 Transcript_13593/m.38254 type:complete len:224 (-) Transcript_13593:426-1097(-)
MKSCWPRFTRSARDGPPTPPSLRKPWSACSMTVLLTAAAVAAAAGGAGVVGADDREGCFEASALAFWTSASPHRDFPAFPAAATFSFRLSKDEVPGSSMAAGAAAPLAIPAAPLTASVVGSAFTSTTASPAFISTLATSLSPQRDFPALAAAATFELRVSYNLVAAEAAEAVSTAVVEASDDAAPSKSLILASYLVAVANSAACTACSFCCWALTMYSAMNFW